MSACARSQAFLDDCMMAGVPVCAVMIDDVRASFATYHACRPAHGLLSACGAIGHFVEYDHDGLLRFRVISIRIGSAEPPTVVRRARGRACAALAALRAVHAPYEQSGQCR